MNHNKHGLKVGDVVAADGHTKASDLVKIIGFTPNQMFATIHHINLPETDCWEIMTRRLTPVEK